MLHYDFYVGEIRLPSPNPTSQTVGGLTVLILGLGLGLGRVRAVTVRVDESL